MSQEEFETQVRRVIAETFGLTADGGDLRMGAVPGWDSMGHMNLVMAIEEAFHVRFPTPAIADLVDVASISEAVRRAKAK
jgi:acyl carrier protein